MKIIPSTWINLCSPGTDFKKISSLATVLVLSFLLFPILSPACVVTCKSNLNVSLDGTGQAVITPLILLQDPSCDPAGFTVNITNPNDISVGNTLTCDHVGLTMKATVTQTSTGNSCWTFITVEDYIKPQIICSDTVILCNQSVDPSVIGYPLATDNCSMFANTDLDYVDEFMDLACFAVQGTDTITSQILRTWSVQDESGNVDTCIQMIYLKRVTIDDVTFPAHRDGFAAPALDCSQDPTDLLLTGEPSINGIPIDNSGNCELIVSHTDQIVPLCGTGEYRVLRTWTVIDYCSGEFTLNVQIINVKDTTAPQISCPADMTVGTLQNDCSAIVNLPLASVTDDCSGFEITPSWAYGTGYGPFLDVPVGTHVVTYTAEDDCGNMSTCTMNVEVVDNIPPTPVCDYSTVVDLSIFGSAIIYANTFDDGSHDNCGIDSIAVSRDGINFGPYVSFDCSDIENSPVEVTLRIWDLAGNYNECTVNTIVDDKISPVIACPSNVYINCYEDYKDLNITGLPIVEDNCLIDTFYYSDVLDLNTCNEGTVTRTWTVEDVNGNSNICIQLITLEDNTPLGIIWPEDYVTSICGANTSDSITGQPIFTNNDCENISATYTDEVFYNSPSCYRILRAWSVYEWCTYDPNNGTNDGYWTDVQIIDVEDHSAPSLSCPSDTIVAMFAADCSGVFVNLAAPTAIDCNPNVEITNDSPYATGNAENASGFYPPGIHTINYTATDDCGNFTACSITVSVVDAKAPTPICYGSISVTIGMNGTVSITPDMINLASYDNCTIDENLIISVSPEIFTCDDLGLQTVTLTVTDEAGNSAICTSVVDVQNNLNICDVPSAMISGVIENENGMPVNFVDMMLSGTTEDTVNSDITGYYEFPEVPLSGNYEVKPVKDNFLLNGVTTIDLVFMQRHILGIQEITSPYKLIAADINKSGGISTIDVVRLRRAILHIDSVFLNNTSWRFVQESYVFPNPTSPFSSPFPESLIVNELEEDILTADFIAVKIGDVNGNANPGQFGGEGDSRNEGEVLNLKTPSVDFEQGEVLEVPVFADNFDQMLGYQMTVDFDETVLEFIEVDKGILKNMSDDHFNFSKIDNGLITSSWTRPEAVALDSNKPLFILKFYCRDNGSLKNHFDINSKMLQAEAYSDQLEILGINFEFSSGQDDKEEQFMLYQNYPNPFDGITKVPFFLPTVEIVRFEVLDAKGTIVQTIEKQFDSGYQEITLKRSDFGASGIYFFQTTRSNGEQQVKSLIVK